MKERAPAAARAFVILRWVAGHGPSTLGEIVDGTGLNRSSAYYLIQTLVGQEALEVDDAGRRYRLGIGLVELGAAAAEGLSELALAKRYLAELLERLDVTIVLYRRVSPTEVVLVDKLERVSRVRITLQMGARIPIQGGSFGRAFLAFDPPELVAEVLDGGLEAYTPSSETDVEAFTAELAEVRTRGWSIDKEGFALGVSTVAAPIFGPEGSIRLVAAAVGFATVMTDDVVARCGAELRDICARVTAALANLELTDRRLSERRPLDDKPETEMED